MKLGKREVEQVKSTSKAQSICSSRMSSRRGTPRRGSRAGSMDQMEDDGGMQKIEESKQIIVPRTDGGKIINQLGRGEERDSNQNEKEPDPFTAEQTYISEDEIKQAQKNRKGSYDEMDQEMGGEVSEQPD